jgi:hypothetical protein
MKNNQNSTKSTMNFGSGKWYKTFFKPLALVAILLLSWSTAEAVTYYTWTNGDPTTTTVWWTGTNGTGSHPTVFTNAADLFIIQNNNTMSTTTSWSVTGGLQINSGCTFTSTRNLVVGGNTSITGTLTLSGSNRTHTFSNVTLNNGANWNITATGTTTIGISGNFTNNATTFTASARVYTFSGTAKTISGSTATVIPSTTVTGTVTNSGTLTVSTALAGAGTLTNTGTLNIGGTSTITNLTASAVNNTVNYTSASAQAVKSITYHHLGFSGAGAKTPAAGTITVNGNWDVAGGTATLNTNNNSVTVTGNITGAGPITSGSGTITVGGDWTNNGTFTKGTGTVVYNGSAAQSVAALSYNNLTFSGSGQKNAAGNLTIGAALNNASVLDMAANTLTLGTSTVNTNGTVRFSGASNGLVLANGTVEYYGTTAQTVTAGTYSGLTISNTTGATIDASTSTSNLTINASGILNVAATKSLTVSTSLTNNGTLNLLSDTNGSATLLTPSTVAGSGSTYINQYLTGSGGSTPNGRFWYLSNPLESSTASGFGVNGTSSKLWKYVESSHAYGTVANADVMEKGRGYVSRLGSNTTVAHGAAGVKVNTGDQVVTISRTGTTDGKRGYNLVGNPYPAYVALDILDNPDIESSMWYRSINVSGNGMVYDTWNFLTETGVVNSGSGALTSDIAPMQAFWVRAKNAGNTDVTFRQANTKHQPGSVKLRSAAVASAQKIRMNVSNGTVSDEALIGFYANAADSYDAYDSYKFSNENPAVPELFTYAGSEELAINGLAPLEGEKELLLGFRTGKTGTYTLNATEISNFEEGTKIILKDKMMNVVQDLNASPNYTFTSDATTTDARFSLVITKVATAIHSVDQEPSCLAFAENGGRINVQVNNLELNNAKINIFDVSGKCLLTKSVEGTVTSFDSRLPQGLYLVEVSQGSFAARNKVIINK